MRSYVNRALSTQVIKRLLTNPAVALLGPRQCGKSTLAKHILSHFPNTIYLDLESPTDLYKLENPESYFKLNKNALICIDEVQRAPDLFQILRSVIDANGRNGQFLILGSASRDLLNQSSETLAGRIGYLELTPFLISEIPPQNEGVFQPLWLKGGFPRSFLAPSLESSFEWRKDFIRTFLERDIPQLGFRIPSSKMDRFWRMCAHSHGQVFNATKLGGSLGVSHNTSRSYLDILEQTFVMRVLLPTETNLKKRLIKSPKIYIRDSGILHALLEIESQNELMSHPVYGSSWEGFVIEQLIQALPNFRPSFYRSQSGVEIDLILERGLRRIAIECKVSDVPRLGKGVREALGDLSVDHCWIVTPAEGHYPIQTNVTVASLAHTIQAIADRP